MRDIQDTVGEMWRTIGEEKHYDHLRFLSLHNQQFGIAAPNVLPRSRYLDLAYYLCVVPYRSYQLGSPLQVHSVSLLAVSGQCVTCCLITNWLNRFILL